MAIKHITMLYAQIKDHRWWNTHEREVHEWLDENTTLGSNESCVGNRVYFTSEDELLWFKLRWDG